MSIRVTTDLGIWCLAVLDLLGQEKIARVGGGSWGPVEGAPRTGGEFSLGKPLVGC